MDDLAVALANVRARFARFDGWTFRTFIDSDGSMVALDVLRQRHVGK